MHTVQDLVKLLPVFPELLLLLEQLVLEFRRLGDDDLSTGQSPPRLLRFASARADPFSERVSSQHCDRVRLYSLHDDLRRFIPLLAAPGALFLDGGFQHVGVSLCSLLFAEVRHHGGLDGVLQ